MVLALSQSVTGVAAEPHCTPKGFARPILYSLET